MEHRVTCKVCGHLSHNLKPHFVGGREECCTVTVEEYQHRYPDAPLTSPMFDRKLTELAQQQKTEATAEIDIHKMLTTEYSLKENFGIDMGMMDTITGFKECHPLVPEIDPEYQFPDEATKIILLGIRLNKPTMVHGPTGSGKTTLIEQIAARINYPVMRINHQSDMYSYDIVGQVQIREGETTFEYGPLPFSMERPLILIMDEWDAINPEIGMMYQPVLERRHDGRLGNIILTAAGGQKVVSNPMFRIVATSNTCGLGDDKGHYQGTQIQNLAFVSRFQLRVKLDYLKPEHEKAILHKKFPTLSGDEQGLLTETARKIREQYEAGRIDVPYSLRDLINWAELYVLLGDAKKAMTYSCTSILPFQDAKTISELIQRIWG
ncbi:CobS: predicted cobaltochelatase [Desulfosarcina variabilis str. Montpellier]|uniref:AAA family ATPase n=1 Tax=Desulfosarcina variabilis TaxID=2300 RepID=UPI003AFA9405